MTTRGPQRPRYPGVIWAALVPLHLMLLGTAPCNTDNDGDGYTELQRDCDDADPATFFGAAEICDAKDNDCDTQIDEDVGQTFYPDQDKDGYGTTVGAVFGCTAPAGYVLVAGDCNDTDASIHPGALEACDGKDNDCDGAPEAADATRYYQDQDKDGFGTEQKVICAEGSGYIAVRGDCNDTATAYHPGADDPAGDGKDQDCGGTSGQDPHVGLSSSSQATLQAALNTAAAGVTVWVGPNTYLEHDLSFLGKAIKLRSTAGPSTTIIDAGGQGRVVSFETGETADALLDGFEITGGAVVGNGGGIYIAGAAPTITGCVITGNRADGYVDADTFYGGFGGGVALESSSATFNSCVISSNQAVEASYDTGYIIVRSGGGGGAVYVSGDTSAPTFTGCTLADNSTTGASSVGGGIAAIAGTLNLSGCTLSGNAAEGTYALSSGGALYLVGAGATLTNSTFSDNRAGTGGGIYMLSTSPTLSGCKVFNNVASGTISRYLGGGMYLESSSPTVSNSFFAGNRADYGGGIYVSGSSPVLTNTAVIANSAWGGGGGLYLIGSAATPQIRNAVIAYNSGYNLFNSSYSPGMPSITYSDLYSPDGPSTNLDTLDASNLAVDPGFVKFSNDGDGSDDDYHLAPGSPLFNTGDPALKDTNGSRSDMGPYGGPAGDQSYYRDADADGMYDGWELAHGLYPYGNDSELDDDEDNATNAEEFALQTDPKQADTDGDQAGDGAEVQAGTDPADWYSRPGVAGVATARVPEDFPTIQAAIDAVQWNGAIDVNSGTWQQNLRIEGKSVAITGRRGGVLTILQGDGRSVVTAVQAKLELKGFTVTGGTATSGGGLNLAWVTGDLTDLTISANSAETVAWGAGGGIFLYYSSPTLTNCTLSGNAASLSGGGMYLGFSSPTLIGCTFNGNRAQLGGGLYVIDESSVSLSHCVLRSNTATSTLNYASGGGMQITGGSATVADTTISGNVAMGVYGYGGGVRMSGGEATFTNCSIDNNSATGATTSGRGGGLHVTLASPVLQNCALFGNSATGATGNATADAKGGGLYVSSGDPQLTNCRIQENSVNGTSSYGGGLYLEESSPTLTNCTIAANTGNTYAGIYLSGSSSTPLFKSSVIAYNGSYNLYNNPSSPAYPTLIYSDLYNPSGSPNHNLAGLDGSNLTVEPAFLAYDTDGLPIDAHLALASPLISKADPGISDPDGSRSDMGAYGGPAGGAFDLDDDGYFDYFWPGTITDAPAGYDPASYDCDDLDAEVTACPSEMARIELSVAL